MIGPRIKLSPTYNFGTVRVRVVQQVRSRRPVYHFSDIFNTIAFPNFERSGLDYGLLSCQKSYNYFFTNKTSRTHHGVFRFKTLSLYFQQFKIILQSTLGHFGMTRVRYLIGKIILKQRIDPFRGPRSVDSSRLVHNISDSTLSMGNFITNYNNIESYSNLWSFR